MNEFEQLPFETILTQALDDLFFVILYEEPGTFRYGFLNDASTEGTYLTKAHIGKTLQESHDEDFAATLQAHYEEVIRTKQPVVYEDTFISSAGKWRCAQIKLKPFLKEDGTIPFITAVVKDLTDEKMAQNAYGIASERLKESRSRYRSLFENNADAVFSLDLEGRIVSANESAERLLGTTLPKLIGKSFTEDLVTETYGKKLHSKEIQSSRSAETIRLKILGNGREIGVLVNFTPVLVKEQTVGMYAVVKDMTELDRMASQYLESENRFRIIAENSQDVISLMDVEGVIVYVSPSVERVYGVGASEFVGKKAYFNIHPDEAENLEQAIVESMVTGEPFMIEVRVYHIDSHWVLTELRGTPVFDKEGNFVHMVTMARDITRQKERENELMHYAFHDSLTGLPNRRFFRDRVQEYVDDSERRDEIIAIGIVDIDDFKQINDELGHESGDAVIEQFGRLLSEVIGEDGVAARLGGDEFALLLPGVQTEEQAEAFVEKIREAVSSPFKVGDASVFITVSTGLTLAAPKSETVSSFLKKADMAMYEMKEKDKKTDSVY